MTDTKDKVRAALNAYPGAEVPPSRVAIENVMELLAAKDREIAVQKAAYEHVKSVMHKHEESLSEAMTDSEDFDGPIMAQLATNNASLRALLNRALPYLNAASLSETIGSEIINQNAASVLHMEVIAALKGTPAPALCKHDRKPCYVSAGTDDAHWRCGTSACTPAPDRWYIRNNIIGIGPRDSWYWTR